MATSRSQLQKCKQTAQSFRSICQWTWTAKHRATVRASLGSAAAGSEGQTETCKFLKSFRRKTVFKTVIRIPLWIPCLLQICAPVEIREFPPTAGRAAPTLHFRSCLMFFQTHPKATHIASDTLGAINSHNSRAALSTLLRSFTGKVSRKASRWEAGLNTHTHTCAFVPKLLIGFFSRRPRTRLLFCIGLDKKVSDDCSHGKVKPCTLSPTRNTSCSLYQISGWGSRGTSAHLFEINVDFKPSPAIPF